MQDLGPAYLLMLRICGVGILIDALERMVSIAKYRDDGSYGWIVLRQRLVSLPAPLRRLGDALFQGAGRLMTVLAVRIVALAFVALGVAGSPGFAIGLTLLIVTQIYICVRTGGFGAIGADPMTLVVCGAAWLAIVVAGTPLAAWAGLWFVAAQSCLAYLVAGVSKLKSPAWRSGAAMAGVLSTHTYGSPRLHALVSARPRLSWFLCWSVMLWEATFPVVLVAPDPIVLLWFGVGVLFHVSLAALMGLNLFLFAFSSTYVAIWAVTH